MMRVLSFHRTFHDSSSQEARWIIIASSQGDRGAQENRISSPLAHNIITRWGRQTHRKLVMPRDSDNCCFNLSCDGSHVITCLVSSHCTGAVRLSRTYTETIESALHFAGGILQAKWISTRQMSSILIVQSLNHWRNFKDEPVKVAVFGEMSIFCVHAAIKKHPPVHRERERGADEQV